MAPSGCRGSRERLRRMYQARHTSTRVCAYMCPAQKARRPGSTDSCTTRPAAAVRWKEDSHRTERDNPQVARGSAAAGYAAPGFGAIRSWALPEAEDDPFLCHTTGRLRLFRCMRAPGLRRGSTGALASLRPFAPLRSRECPWHCPAPSLAARGILVSQRGFTPG